MNYVRLVWELYSKFGVRVWVVYKGLDLKKKKFYLLFRVQSDKS